MRARKKNKSISVHAIAGTQVVLLGLNATEEGAKGLLGFTILKRKGKSGSFKALGGGGPRFKGSKDSDERDSRTAPIQRFMWSDYEAEPGQSYTYRVIPVYGTPADLEKGESLDVTVRTENPEKGTHGIYFNRGVAGSQAYSREFGEYLRYYLSEGFDGRPRATPFIKPGDVPNRKAYKWLSRGLEEAMMGFIDQAKGSRYQIRAAVYELTYVPVIQKFVDALERGVDVKIIHHAKRENSYRMKGVRVKKGEPTPAKPTTTTAWTEGAMPKDAFNANKPTNKYISREESKDAVCSAADKAVSQVGLKQSPDKKLLYAFDKLLIERKITQISHNKFMVLLKDGKPIQVWTGSTNYTEGGIFGQSNVGHIVRDAGVAKKYLDYWKKLSTDPKKKSARNDPPFLGMQNWTVRQQPVLKGPPPAKSITPVFSPRLKPARGEKDMLDWYAEQLDGAKHSVFLTSAFSVAEQFLNIVKDVKKDSDTPYLRYLLLEGKGGLLKDKYPIMKACSQNRVAYGDTLRRRKDEDERQQFIETLTGLNDHVNYLHTKYMLIDPLSDDPIVITGSANFSDASTHDNDENMLIIRGDTGVADIFLGEFMRLFNHFKYRNRANSLSSAAAKKTRLLASSDGWQKPYFTEGSREQQERLLFS